MRARRHPPNQRMLKQMGTDDLFPYTEALMARGDMEEFDQYSHHHGDKAVINPDTGKGSESKLFLKEVLKLDREHIQEGLGTCKNKLQKMLWCLLNLWEKCPSALLSDFKPRFRDLSIMMGPNFTLAELEHAVKIFKQNPNKEYLMSDAVNDFIPS